MSFACTSLRRVTAMIPCVVLILTVLTVYLTPASAQISAGGTPPSFSIGGSSLVPTAAMPLVDEQALLAEDETDAAYGRVDDPRGQRFAYAHEVSLNLTNSGLWETLPNGDRIWRLRIESAGARSIHLIYDHWELVKGSQLFLYNDAHDYVIGAFTPDNNWVDGTNITGPVKSDATTLEYIVPGGQNDVGELSISQVCHAYRSLFDMVRAIDGFGDANACQVNVNCAEGSAWQDEKRGVAMIISGVRWCTGSMINNTRGDFWPYFLTAEHCLDGNQTNWMFIFNYEAAGCANPGSEPSLAQSVANATQISAWGVNPGSDFALLRLSGPPPSAYTPYYNGWDRNNVAATTTRSIHHPNGDIKKINRDDQAAVSDYWNNAGFPNTHWNILAWEVGGNEGGSSGSPCFDQNSRIKGQLTGGYEACNATDASWYGKLSHSWAGGGSSSTRLSDWLDPDATGNTTTDGAYPSVPFYDVCNGYNIGSGNAVLPFTHTRYTTYSANDYGNTCRTFPGPDNVYSWTASCSTTVTVSLCGGTTWDTGLYVRRDTCTTGTVVACNDDFCGLQSELTFNASPGHRYYIFVDGYSATSYGLYTINVSAGVPFELPLTIDDCSGAMPINSLPFGHTQSTCRATNSRTNCVGPTSPDVFYHLNLAECQDVTVSLCGSNYDTGIEVTTGGVCPGTTLVACNDDFCGLQSQTTFTAIAGESYYLIVHGFSFHYGWYALNVTGTPFTAPGDNCSNVISIGGLPYANSGDTRCANYDFPKCGGSASADVIYQYTAPQCEAVTASLCGSGYDTRIDVWEGGACPGENFYTCNDDACGLQSEVTFVAAQGVTYYIRVSGFAVAEGAYTLNVTSGGAISAPNDLCGTPLVIGSLPFIDWGSTACATDNNYAACTVNSSPDVVYRFNVPASSLSPCAVVNVSLCGSSYDTYMEIRDAGGGCPGGGLIACADDGYCNGAYGLQTTLVFAPAPSTDYYILVYGFSGNSGTYRLEANIVCDPDSLVAQIAAGNSILLDWAPVAENTGIISYKVYRASTPDVPIIPGNHIGTTSVAQFLDAGVLTNPAEKFFYAVTTDASFLTLESPAEEPVQTLDANVVKEKSVTAAQAVTLPAYIDPANIGGPNPNKPESPGR